MLSKGPDEPGKMPLVVLPRRQKSAVEAVEVLRQALRLAASVLSGRR